MNPWLLGFLAFAVMMLFKYFTQGAGFDPNAQAAGAAFLATKEAEAGVYKLPSGMLFKILNKGNGAVSPLPSTKCSCHYEGTLITGKVFDSSYRRGQPIDFAPNQVIPGWTEALQMMREGDKWEVFLPYNLAYGTRGAGSDIPPFATLVFTMELVKVKGAGRSTEEVDRAFVKYLGKKYADL